MGHGCDLPGARVRRDRCNLGLEVVVRSRVGGCGASESAISSSAGRWCDLGGASGDAISPMLGCDETSAIWGWGRWCDLG